MWYNMTKAQKKKLKRSRKIELRSPQTAMEKEFQVRSPFIILKRR